jgi:hypothetical protein
LTATQRRSGAGVDRRPIVASALWTLFVWGTRVRNIAGDDDLSGAERAYGYLVCGLFVGTAVALLVMLVRHSDGLRLLLAAFAVGTVGWWVLRSVLILVHEHSWAFRVVHVVLGIVSSALAVVAWRAARVRS